MELSALQLPADLRWNGWHSSAFTIERGVRQGCITRLTGVTGIKCETDQSSENWEVQSEAGVVMDDEQMEVVEHFKYLESQKSADGNCSK